MIFLTLLGIYRPSTTYVLIFRYKLRNLKMKTPVVKKIVF